MLSSVPNVIEFRSANIRSSKLLFCFSMHVVPILVVLLMGSSCVGSLFWHSQSQIVKSAHFRALCPFVMTYGLLELDLFSLFGRSKTFCSCCWSSDFVINVRAHKSTPVCTFTHTQANRNTFRAHYTALALSHKRKVVARYSR